MRHNIYIYILITALVSYGIRMLPMVLLRKEIEKSLYRSFLYYVPYVTLAVMTFRQWWKPRRVRSQVFWH